MINCSELIYKVGNKVGLLPTLYYICTAMSIDGNIVLNRAY